MFFVLSKLLFVVARPSNLFALMMIAGLLLRIRRPSRTGGILFAGGFLLMLVSGWSGVAALLLEPLEQRFPAVVDLAEAPTGIIILGGPQSAAGHRLVAAAALARRYPDASVVFTGGSGAFVSTTPPEADVAGPKLLALGVDPNRLLLENRSRNTPENAGFTYDLVRPEPGQRWVLITSAFHMPRSVGVFRVAGWTGIVPYPVDFRAHEAGFVWESSSLARGLETVDVAVREWIGLVAYRALGYTDALFPAPRDAVP